MKKRAKKKAVAKPGPSKRARLLEAKLSELEERFNELEWQADSLESRTQDMEGTLCDLEDKAQ